VLFTGAASVRRPPSSGAPERTWIEESLPALVANARAVLSRNPAVRLLQMVKANAYGLGAVSVARALEALDPWGFGVATVQEGAELRRAGIQRPTLVVAPTLGALEEARAPRLTVPSRCASHATEPADPLRRRHSPVTRPSPTHPRPRGRV